MSLLDDVNIVVTPNGYKAGELYAVIPVPTLGAELVDDGDFPTPNTEWTISGEATISGGMANIISTAGVNTGVTQTVPMTTGLRYRFQYEVISNDAGFLKTDNADISTSNLPSTVGVHFIDFINIGNFAINFKRSSGVTDISITNVSVKEYTSADMDVTRATAATRVDENGLVNYAEIIGGEEIATPDFSSSTGWSFTNSGGSNGWIIDAGRAICDSSAATPYRNLNSTFSLVNGKSYRLIIDILQSADNMKIVVGGITLSETLPTGTNLNYEYFIPESAHSGGGFTIYAGSSDLQEIDNVSVKEVTRDNVPRIDYTGGGCPHILAEPQRTNLVTYSEVYGAGTFFSATSGSTIDNTTSTSPSGDANATQVTSTGAGKIQSVGLALAQNTDYVLSFYAKNVDATLVYSRVLGLGGTGGSNLTLVDYTSQLSTTEWTRITHSFNTGTNTTAYVYLSSALNSGGTIQLWGAQLEEGTYATSYIPTSGSTVTRNKDIFTRDGIGSLINSTEGVLYFEGSTLENGGSSHRIISLSDGTSNNLIYIRFDNTASRFRGFARGSSGSYTIITVNSIPQTDNNKIALVWDATNFRIWINGSERATTTINDVPVGMNALNLADTNGTADPLFGKVKQLQVYKTALTDVQLAALTS